MIKNDEFLFSEQYRPRTVSECILPKHLKETFQSFVDNKEIPNLLLTGSSGVGKTSIARALLEELDLEYIFINASLNASIDNLRNDIQQFASSVSFKGTRKYIILDELDNGSNSHVFQPALRGFIEEFSASCGFIFTCNFPNKILDAVKSRCSIIDFTIPPDECEQLASEFFASVKTILMEKNIKFDSKVVAVLIEKFFPDWRRTLNELQRYSIRGKIDSGILAELRDTGIDELIGFLKEKNFNKVRKWVGERNIDSSTIFRQLYDESDSFLKEESIPQLVLFIAKYQKSAAVVADLEINFVAFLVEVMCDCSFK